MKTITIQKSPTAGLSKEDLTGLSGETLMASSLLHIADVAKGLAFFSGQLTEAAAKHDWDKIACPSTFLEFARSGFTLPGWFENHIRVNRHHLASPDGVPEDVNLIDILEYISDCTMAAKARGGEMYALKTTPELLEKAFKNTVELLKSKIEVA